eukprot:461984-Amphidinium_carterae.1
MPALELKDDLGQTWMFFDLCKTCPLRKKVLSLLGQLTRQLGTGVGDGRYKLNPMIFRPEKQTGLQGSSTCLILFSSCGE